MVRLFFLDDHTVLREGLRLMLGAQPDLQVVGEAGSGKDLLAQLAETPTDVVLLDLCLPGLSGADIMRLLTQQHAAAQVLVLSSSTDPAQVRALFGAGAWGYALKSVGIPELAHGIRTVAVGRPFLCAELGLAALQRVRNGEATAPATEAPTPIHAPIYQVLTKRELEVLRLLAEGFSNQEMADRLFTSKRTVETHRQNLMAKVQAKNTAALVRLASRHGWLLS